jgi:2'-5' RNA ligase
VLRTAAIQLGSNRRLVYLEVPNDVRRYLRGVGERIATETGGEADDADHVTLCFVPKSEGALSETEVEGATEAISRALRHAEPFDVWLGGIAYFDTAEKDGESRTAAVALVDGPGLTELHEAVRDALHDFGWDWDPRHNFTPHVTLAYLAHGGRARTLPVVEAAWTLDGVRLAHERVHRIAFGRDDGRKTAELRDVGLLSFRTTPDAGHGLLYPYCSDCQFLARAPAPARFGCSNGDDPDVRSYSDRLDRGETAEAAERCPGYTPVDATASDEGISDDTSVVQAVVRKVALEEGEERFFVWRAEPDACEICLPLDGVVFGMSDPLPHGPPGAVHDRCRCTGTPIGWAEAMLRREALSTKADRSEAGMVKEVPSEDVRRDDDADELSDVWRDESAIA